MVGYKQEMPRMLYEAHKIVDHVDLPDDHQSILPIMTALFVDSLGGGGNKYLPATARGDNDARELRGSRIFRLPLQYDTRPEAALNVPVAETRDLNKRHPISHPSLKTSAERSSIRPLITGISHHFNNLLMGIWGNATLIRMQLTPEDPNFDGFSHIERLIQSGSFLIHTVLGYLGERRYREKMIRLRQLLGQLREELPDSDAFNEDCWNFEERLRYVSRIQCPRMIAGSTARVLEVLFQGAEALCRKIDATPIHCPDMESKIATIKHLVIRGLNLTDQLRMYSEEFNPDKARIRLAPLMRRVLNRIYNLPDDIRINFEAADKLPLVRGEREKLEWVFEQFVDNAVAAMPEGGQIDITIRSLRQEVAEDHCTVQKGRYFVVVTIKDNGNGIPVKMQKRIFKPFVSSAQRNQRHGLGLAAVKGVVKAHNGYIQVQSKYKMGSTFKVFLPLAGTTVNGLG